MQLSVVRGNEVVLSLYGNKVCHQESLLHTVSGIAETYSPTPRCLKMPARTGSGGVVKVKEYDAHLMKDTGGAAFNPSGSAPGLTKGEITGITLGVLALVGIPLLICAGVAGFFVYRKVQNAQYRKKDGLMARSIKEGLGGAGGNSQVTASYTDL
jgi:hypothetical protein